MIPTVVELVGCRYRARWARALPSWDLLAVAGEVVHIVGPNGAGKSTFLRAAVGLEPSSWTRHLLGTSPRAAGVLRFLGASTGVSPDLLVCHHVELVARLLGIGSDDVRSELDRWGVLGLLAAAGGDLSNGQHRAVALASVLAGSPSIVVLDEPAVALDELRQDLLVQRLAECVHDGAVVVVAGHDRHLRSGLPGRVVEHG